MSGAKPWRTAIRVFLPLMFPTFAGVWIWVLLHSVNIAGLPLMLYQGTNNQVLSIIVWNMWNNGYTLRVAAIGTVMMVLLSIVTLAVRMSSFRRSSM